MLGLVSKKKYNEDLKYQKGCTDIYREQWNNEIDLNRNIVSKNERLIKIKNELLGEKLDLEFDLRHCEITKVTLVQEINQLKKDLELADQTIKQYEQIINRLGER